MINHCKIAVFTDFRHINLSKEIFDNAQTCVIDSTDKVKKDLKDLCTPYHVCHD